MNKYQEALDFLEEECRAIKKSESKKYVGLLQELVEKATPKKTLTAFADGITADGSIVQKTALVCPSCKSLLVERQSYCTKCGQILDWRVEDENNK